MVTELWRYPVKSLRGQQLQSVAADSRSVEYDRLWAVVGQDGKIASGKTTRRFRRMPDLLTMDSFVDDDGTGWIRFADGSAHRIGDVRTERLVSEVVGEPVEVAAEGSTSHLDDSPIHLVSRQTLDWVHWQLPSSDADRRRFRPNVVLDVSLPDDRPEETWIGCAIQLGTATLRVTHRAVRCVMITQPQDDLRFQPRLLQKLEEANEMTLGVYAAVEVPGTLNVCDEVRLA